MPCTTVYITHPWVSMVDTSTVGTVPVPKRSALPTETSRREISETVSFGIGAFLVAVLSRANELRKPPRGCVMCDVHRRRIRYMPYVLVVRFGAVQCG